MSNTGPGGQISVDDAHSSLVGVTAARQPQRDGRSRALGRLLIGAVWLLAAVAAFFVYLRLSSTQEVDSDGASQALQAWDMLHGNPLLRGWMMADASLYTTEIPEDMLIEAVRGLSVNVVHIGAALTYTLDVLLAAFLAKGKATGREAVLRVLLAAGIMFAPSLGSGTYTLLLDPDHTGTAVPLLLAWLILDRARPRWQVAVAIAVILGWTQVADPIALPAAIGPLFAVCALRVCADLVRRRREGDADASVRSRQFWRANWYEAALAGAAVAAVAAGDAAPRIISALGGFVVAPVHGSALAPISVLGAQLANTGQSALLLAGASTSGTHSGIGQSIAALHYVGLGLVVIAIVVTAARFFRAELLCQVLLAAIIVLLAAFALSMLSKQPVAREIAPALPFSAALAGRQLAGYLARWSTGPRGSRPRILARAALSVLGLVLAGYTAGLAWELTAPKLPPEQLALSNWLERHPIGNGLSGYWTSNVVTVTTKERVAIRRVIPEDGKIGVNYGDNMNVNWFNPALATADFVVLAPGTPGQPGFQSLGQCLATFGKPAVEYRVGPYLILRYHKNLLADLVGKPTAAQPAALPAAGGMSVTGASVRERSR